MPRFAVLMHDHPFPHWDLLLESGAVARTWRLMEEPGPSRAIRAELLSDHRLMYLEYEGPVSGGRGTVGRWDAGEYRFETDEPTRVAIRLKGKRLQGKAVLEQTPADGWTFRFAPD